MVSYIITETLKEIKRTGPGKWMALCPAHNDKNPSLSLTDVGDKLLMHCHHGCSTNDILAALGLDWSALFNSEQAVTHGGFSTTCEGMPLADIYDYKDLKGQETLYYVLRYEDGKGSKTFRPWRNENGTPKLGMGDTEALPYRIYGVVSSSADDPVIIPEGEKDVDTLHGEGFIATTNPFGATKWKLEYGEYFHNRNIFVIPDNDESGLEHASKLVEMLSGVAASVTILELPNLPGKKTGEDVTDWMREGHTAEELQQLIREAKQTVPRENPFTPVTLLTAEEILGMEFPEPEFIIPGIIPEGLTMLVGPAKTGKSWLCLDLALSMASGREVFGCVEPDPASVLYLPFEDSMSRLKHRIQLLKYRGGNKSQLLIPESWSRASDGGMEDLVKFVRDHPEVKLIIIDTLARFRDNSSSRKGQYQKDYDDMVGLQDLARANQGLGIIVVHHTRKMASDDPMDLINGTNGLGACADTTLVCQRVRMQNQATLSIMGRDLEERELGMEFGSDLRWRIIDRNAIGKSEQRQAILECVNQSDKPLGPKEVSEVTGLSYDSVRQLMPKMADAGTLGKAAYGVYVSVASCFLDERARPSPN